MVVGRLMDLVLLVPVRHTVGVRVQVGLQHGVDIGLPFRGGEMGDVASNRMSHVENPVPSEPHSPDTPQERSPGDRDTRSAMSDSLLPGGRAGKRVRCRPTLPHGDGGGRARGVGAAAGSARALRPHLRTARHGGDVAVALHRSPGIDDRHRQLQDLTTGLVGQAASAGTVRADMPAEQLAG